MNGENASHDAGGPGAPARNRTRVLIDRRRPFAWLIGCLVFTGAVVTAAQDHSSRTSQDRVDAGAVAYEIGLRLQSVLNNRLALTGGLAAYARSHEQELNQGEFEVFAADMAASFERYQGPEWVDPSVRSLQLAPDGIVTFIWPLEGNEAAIGHDIINDPARGDAVRRSIDEGAFVLAGPFDLLQGGRGLVGRSPIFTGAGDTERFWGFATVVLNFDEVLYLANLDQDIVGEHRIALRGRDGTGAIGEVFFGPPDVFEADAVLSTINLPDGSWQLAAVPEQGWTGFGGRSTTRVILLAGLLGAIAIGVLCRRWLDALALAQRASDDVAVLLESIDGPVVSTDARLQVTHWNRSVAVLTGIAADRAVGKDLETVTSEFRSRRGDATIASTARLTLRDGSSRTVETTVATADEPTASGDARGFDFAVAARRDGGVVLVGLDATARREHDRISADLAALEQTSKMKDDFLTSTSHEMRTPLTSILGLAELLADGSLGELSERQQRAVETVERTGAHLLSVVNQVLDVATITANGLELELTQVPIAQVARSAVEIAEPLAAARSIELHASIDAVGCLVEGDQVRLGEVMLNLLSNAVKFTDEGGDIGIDVETQDDTVVITVWDTGVGIPADKQYLLFRPFVRIENSTFAEGTGLGLSIAYEIVRLHQGTLTVDSDPGRRTEFVVRLPLDKSLSIA